jgi:hypothetical protein
MAIPGSPYNAGKNKAAGQWTKTESLDVKTKWGTEDAKSPTQCEDSQIRKRDNKKKEKGNKAEISPA